MNLIEVIGSIPTPMGQLVCEQWNEAAYPCFDLVLKRPGGTEILLAVVEYDSEDNVINIRSYPDMIEDEPTHNDTITPEDIELYARLTF